jgi:hypothetical protein
LASLIWALTLTAPAVSARNNNVMKIRFVLLPPSRFY